MAWTMQHWLALAVIAVVAYIVGRKYPQLLPATPVG